MEIQNTEVKKEETTVVPETPVVVEAPKVEEPVKEPTTAPEPPKNVSPVVPKMAKEGQINLEDPNIGKIPYRKETDAKLSHEERILAFIDSRKGDGNVKLNDFLKSLYPIPKANMPAAWTDQGAMKRLRVLLEKMQQEGKIEIISNSHNRLGRPYYPDDTTLKTEYYHLGTVLLECAKK